MSRGKKDDAPLNTLVEYYAFKAEERTFFERYPNQHPNPDIIKDSHSVPIPVFKIFQSYLCEKTMPQKEFYISEKQYL